MKPNMCRAGTRKGKIKLKKRLLSILLAAVMVLTMLPLGLVDTAWAAETQDTQRKAVTERAQAYIAACNNFSAQNGQSIPYWTISDAEFEGYVQTKTRDKAAETSKLKKQVDAGDFMSALTTKTCTGSNGSHQWSKEKYTCRSHYFSGLDNRGEGYSQCQGFANYMAYVLFGEAGTSESNFTKMTQVGYGFDFQPGDVLRVLDGDKNGHSMVVYAGSGSSAKVIECNWGHSSRGYCNVRWDLTVAQKQKQFPTVETVWRPNASLAVTSGGTDSGGGTTVDVIGSGNCGANGSNVTWKLTSDGTLTINGTGKMADYEWSGAPWYDVRSQVKKAVIEDGVTSIGNYAFFYCTSLTSVMIPVSVISIGEDAFSSCTSLTSAAIPSSVTSIESGAFRDCTSLKGVTIPGSVTSIGNFAFYYCTSLTSVTIPNSVTSIGDYTFEQCTSLTSVTIPSSVTSIGIWTFSGCSSLTRVTIPSSVTSIGEGAFRYCEALTSVTIPNSVTSIGDSTFSDCTSLKGVTIPNSVTSIGDYAFYGCSGLRSVTIPSSVTSIGGSTFSNCDSLTFVTIPSSVTSIGTFAFCDCTSMTSMTIPESVTSIGDYAFSYSGMAVNVVSGNKNYCSEDGVLYNKQKTVLLYGGACKGTFKIPNSVTSIGVAAFTGGETLTSVAIPDSVTSIGDDAFFCSGTAVNVASENKNYSSENGVLYNKQKTVLIYGGSYRGTFKIPNSVTSIGESAFFGCDSLTSVMIPNGVTSIGDSAFRVCTNLSSVTIPKSVTNIGWDAFWYCPRLTDVYYKGTASEWAKITIGSGNTGLTNATFHYAVFAEVPAAPTVKIGNSASSGKPMLTWNAVEGATSYRIYRSTSKGSGYSLLGTTTATSYTNTGAKAGTTYYYRVKACNDAGLSPYSNIVSGQVKSVAPKLSAPVVKIGHSATSGKPMLTWNAVSGATSYKVYRATSQKGTYSLLGTVTATSYTNTGAKAGTTYWYKVKAVNSAGESAYSNVVSGKTTVTTLTMGHSATSGKPMLTWKAVSGAASYRVYRATTKNGAYSVINTTKALTYTNTGAALGTTYYYKVEALNASGKSMGFSAVVEGKVAPVLAVGYSSVSGKPQLTWKAVPGATEYQVYRATQQNSGYTKINTTTATSYVNTGAKAGTTYYYRIVAVKGTAVSDFSNIVSARPGK